MISEEARQWSLVGAFALAATDGIPASDTRRALAANAGDRTAIEAIALDLGEFRQVTREQDVFMIAPGHGVEGIDLLIESREGYDLVALEDGG